MVWLSSFHTLSSRSDRAIDNAKRREQNSFPSHSSPCPPLLPLSSRSSLALSSISILSRRLLPPFLFAGHFHLSLSCIYLPPPLPSPFSLTLRWVAFGNRLVRTFIHSFRLVFTLILVKIIVNCRCRQCCARSSRAGRERWADYRLIGWLGMLSID